MLLRELVEQRRILFAQRIDLVLKRLSLHLVELADDRVGVGRSGIAQSEGILIRRVDQRVGLVAGSQLTLVSLLLDHRANVAAAFCHLCGNLVIACLNGVDYLLSRHSDLTGHFVD